MRAKNYMDIQISLVIEKFRHPNDVKEIWIKTREETVKTEAPTLPLVHLVRAMKATKSILR